VFFFFFFNFKWGFVLNIDHVYSVQDSAQLLKWFQIVDLKNGAIANSSRKGRKTRENAK